MFPDLLRDDVFRLETERLWLRWPRAADAGAVARLAGDVAVGAMTMSVPHPYTEADAAGWIFSCRAGNAQGASLVLVMARRSRPAEAIGVVGLHHMRPQAARLGFWLGAAFQGKGLATEAVSAVLDLAFRGADVAVVEAQALADAERGRKALTRCGFREAGSGRVDLPTRGGVFVCDRFLLEREDWRAREAPKGRSFVDAAAVGSLMHST